jgi:IS4 transposase
MAARRRKNARSPAPKSEDAVAGLRYLRLIESQLARLRAHPAHGNREVFLDHLVVAHLLAFFNPHVKGLRSVEDIFDLPGIQARYDVPRLPKSTVADAQAVFDPHLLRPILDSLIEKAGIQPHDARLDAVTRRLLAVDGSFFAVAPRIAWALYNKSCGKGGSNKGHVRAHVQFDIRLGLPVETSLTGGQSAEWKQLMETLRPDCFYVMDRGFQAYELLARVIESGSDFLVRLRMSARVEIVEARPLTAADRAACIASDSIVRLGWRGDQTPTLPALRRVEVTYSDRDGKTTTLILLTNRLDLPAWMIALIYQHRWQIELFFRWLKCVANFSHFFSESQTGMTLQIYIALIGMLLIAIETNAKPSTYDYALLSVAMMSREPMEEVLAVAARRRAERARAAEWQRQYNANKAAKNTGL